MKDLQDILRAAERLDAAGEPYVLATVVRVTGSTYRSPGAHMLITADSRFEGSISGGCVEHDVLTRAKEVLDAGQPALITYDTTAEDDILWGMGLGCSGVLDALLEPFPDPARLDYHRFMARCLENQDVGVIATVFQADGGLSPAFGRRLLLDERGARDNLTDDALRCWMLDGARVELNRLITAAKVLPTGYTTSYTVGEATAHVLVEPVIPPVPLLIFGAGNDAVPLANLARSLGWAVTLVDHRPAYADPSRFPGARVLALDYEEAFERLKFTRRTLALTMTHNYLHDLHILKRIVASPFAYLGALGPRKRTQRLLSDLKKEGVELPADFEERFFSPVGLDIGAETPEEVALSVLAEMQAVLAGRAGGFLRERAGAIHER